MQDPTKPILAAFTAALADLALPVYTTLPADAPADYVLANQPTLATGRGSAGCPAWDATLRFTICTSFAQKGNVSFTPALQVGADLLAKVEGTRLNLGSFSMSPVELAKAEVEQAADEARATVRRQLVLRFTVYGTPTAVPVPVKKLADYSPAELVAAYPDLAGLRAALGHAAN